MLLNLCDPLRLECFPTLQHVQYMLNTNTAHIISTSSQYSDHCLEVVWVAREHISEVYCCLLYSSVLT